MDEKNNLVKIGRKMIDVLPSADTPAFLSTLFEEYHLRPRSAYPKLSFLFFESKPDYVEDPKYNQNEYKDYLFIMKNKRFGILYWHFVEYFFSIFNENESWTVIPCEYDEIEKCQSENGDIYFIGYKNGTRTFFDTKGRVLP